MEEVYSKFTSLSDWVEFPSTETETKEDSFELMKSDEDDHSIMIDIEPTKEESCCAQANTLNLALSSTFSTTVSTVSSPKSSCGSKLRRFDGFHVISPELGVENQQK